MAIASRAECLELLQRFDMPDHIRRHSLLVTEVAVFLASSLNCNGCRLDMRLIEAAALLHDIGKNLGLDTGEDHAILGARMLDGIVDQAIAGIVGDHISLDPSQVAGPITESLIVNYSDKRVRHDHVVSVLERYVDLIARYAKSPSHEQFLRNKLALYFELERTIFSHLTIEPQGTEIMGITIDVTKGV
jgi:putative nucleotidyltransferase with HDIG domain